MYTVIINPDVTFDALAVRSIGELSEGPRDMAHRAAESVCEIKRGAATAMSRTAISGSERERDTIPKPSA